MDTALALTTDMKIVLGLVSLTMVLFVFQRVRADLVALVILVLMGWVTPAQLREARGYAIVGIFILAAIITPPDVVSQLMLAIPMCLLYEAGLIAARMLVPADGRAAAAAAGEPSLAAIVIATLVAFGVGYAVIVWFMRLIENRSYMPFVLYRVIAGTLLLVLLWTGVIDPLAGG